MKNVVLSLTALTLITVSCGSGHDSKREGDSPAATTAAPPPESSAPTMIVARVPIDKVNSESFEDAEFAVTRAGVKNLAQAFSEKNATLGKDEGLTFEQSIASDEKSLCGNCGDGGGGYGSYHAYGRIGFFGGIFRGVGHIVGGVIAGTAQIVHGAKTIVRGTVHGVGELLVHHRPIFTKGGWGFGYGCDGHEDIGRYRYYKYERKGQPIPPPNYPHQGPGQQLPPPTQKPLPPPLPPKGGNDLPPPPIDKGPGDEGGFCEDGCQK
jgi:hypothetical protein